MAEHFSKTKGYTRIGTANSASADSDISRLYHKDGKRSDSDVRCNRKAWTYRLSVWSGGGADNYGYVQSRDVLLLTVSNYFTALTECLDLQESIEGVGGVGNQDPGLGRAPP